MLLPRAPKLFFAERNVIVWHLQIQPFVIVCLGARSKLEPLPASSNAWAAMPCPFPDPSRFVLRFPVINSCRKKHGHSTSVEKRSVKATKAVEQHQLGHRSLGRKEQRRSSKETAHVCKRESQNSEGAKGAVGEGESHEEECLTEARGKGSPHYLIP